MIQLSKAAISEINRLRDRQTREPLYLRVCVKPGGCAQYYYSLEFTSSVDEGDRLTNIAGLTVAIKGSSLPYLQGLSIDYTEDLMGGGFRFDNPNALQSCGCGNSFAAHIDSVV